MVHNNNATKTDKSKEKEDPKIGTKINKKIIYEEESIRDEDNSIKDQSN